MSEIPDKVKQGRDLIAAAKARDYSTMKDLLEKGADANAVEAFGGRTALYYVVTAETTPFARSRMLHLLLEHGADPDKADDKGQAAIHLAAQRGDEISLGTLLKFNANVNARTATGATALHLAVTVALNDAKTGFMQKLIDAGANSLIRDNDEKTPLDRARDREGFSNFYATVIGFLQDWENAKPESRRRDEYYAANEKAQREAADKALSQLRSGSKKYKLKP